MKRPRGTAVCLRWTCSLGVSATLLAVAGCAGTDRPERDDGEKRADRLEARLAESELERRQLALEAVILQERAARAEARIVVPPAEPYDACREMEQRGHNIGDLAIEPKIDGVITRISRESGLIFIDVGARKELKVGMKFTVYRGNAYLSRLEVDHVEPDWCACHELLDFRKDPFESGETVSTRVFD